MPGSDHGHNEWEGFSPAAVVDGRRSLQAATYGCSISILEPSPGGTISDGGYVTVGWSCTSVPVAPALWIGGYSPPPDADESGNQTQGLRNAYPVRLSFGLREANGSVRMQFSNLREPLQFFLMQGGNVFPAVCCPAFISSSPTLVRFANPNEPVRVRLSLVGSSASTALRLQWSCNASGAAAVQWGTSSGSWPYSSPAITTRLRRSQMLNAPANGSGWHDLGDVNAVSLDLSAQAALGPAAQQAPIFYRVTCDGSAWSAEQTLSPPPLPGARVTRNAYTGAEQPLSIAVFGDFGRGSADASETWVEYGRPAYNNSLRLREMAGLQAADSGAVAALGGATISAVWLNGDLSYANGVLTGWESFMSMLSLFAARVPVLSVLGNHGERGRSDWGGAPGEEHLRSSCVGAAPARLLCRLPRG